MKMFLSWDVADLNQWDHDFVKRGFTICGQESGSGSDVANQGKNQDQDLWIRHCKSGRESGSGSDVANEDENQDQDQDQMSRLAEETGSSAVVLGGGGSRWPLISLC